MSLQQLPGHSAPAGRDVNAGLPVRVSCAGCATAWRSPFKPYRMGQVDGLLSRFDLPRSPPCGTAGRTGLQFRRLRLTRRQGRGARGSHDARRALYRDCPQCHDTVCEDCSTRAGDVQVLHREGERRPRHEAGACGSGGPRRRAPQLPQLPRADDGGRFCAECGFDMAITHKTCPACGAMACARRASAPTAAMASDAPRFARQEPCHDRTSRRRRSRGPRRRSAGGARVAHRRGQGRAGQARSCASSWPSCCACSANGSARTPSSTWWPRWMRGAGPMREMVGHALRCEMLRAAVFAGRRSPMVFGAARRVAGAPDRIAAAAGAGEHELAAAWPRSAFDAAPATRGQHRRRAVRVDRRRRHAPRPGARGDGQRPLLLGAVQPPGAACRIEAPDDLRDMRLAAGATACSPTAARRSRWCPRAIPAREASDDEHDPDGAQDRMARRSATTGWAGLGQRVLVTDQRRARPA